MMAGLMFVTFPKNTLCKITGAAGLQLSLQNPLILFRKLMQSSSQTLFADRRQKIETLALSPDAQSLWIF
jgi:hypothetical protein